MIHFQLWFLITVITCTGEEDKHQHSHYLFIEIRLTLSYMPFMVI